MCLYKVNQRLAGRGMKVYTGWKVFEKVQELKPALHPNSCFAFRYYFHNGNRIVPVDQWLKATEGSIESGVSIARYDSGFHIYRYPYVPQYLEKIQDHLVAVKVQYRKVVARGRESDDEVIVAKEMYVSVKAISGRTQNVNKKK